MSKEGSNAGARRRQQLCTIGHGLWLLVMVSRTWKLTTSEERSAGAAHLRDSQVGVTAGTASTARKMGSSHHQETGKPQGKIPSCTPGQF